MRSFFLHPAVRALLVFAVYSLLGQAAIRLTIMPEGIVTFWPPNAIVVAALILSPVRQWALFLAAGIGAEFVANLGFYPLWQSAGFGLVNAVEALLTATLVCRVMLRGKNLERLTVNSALGLGTIFLFVSTPLAALGGAGLYALGDPSILYWEFWRMWWFGDAIGLLVMTPLFLVWLGEDLPIEFKDRSHRLELTAMVLLLGIMGGLVFFAPETWPNWTGSASLLLPILAWAAVRFGVHGATLTTVLIALMAVAGTTQGRGPFFDLSAQAETVLSVQEYLLAAVILALSLGTSVRQFKWAMTKLIAERGLLEQRVLERTKDLEEARAIAEQSALTDALTGLNNRRAFFQFGKTVEDQAKRYGHRYSVIMLDIDYFKAVNDKHGHALGDITLQAVADKILAVVRAADVAGRIGGEEFAICLPQTDLDKGKALAERLRQAICDIAIPVTDGTLKISASFGISECRSGEAALESILLRADEALYQAKQQGRNRVVADETSA